MKAICTAFASMLGLLIAISIMALSIVYADRDVIHGAKIVKKDIENKIIHLELHEQLVSGSDGACQAAGEVIAEAIEIMGDDWRVFVTNDWVPSKHNPINKKWAERLKEGY